MLPDSRRRLESFVARAEELRQYPFFDGGERITEERIRKVGGRSVWEYTGPPISRTRDAHLISGVLLHLKVFTQAKDDTSIIKGMGTLHRDPCVSEAWKEEHEAWCQELVLRFGHVAIESGAERVTNEELFNMVLHGRLGHEQAHRPEYQRYSRWVSSDQGRALVESHFVGLVIDISAIVFGLAVACRDELQRD